jgi:Skp family chaperone for outer membrane proteins
MKRISTLTLSFLFAAVFAVSAFGQAAAQPATMTKIGWIETQAFGDDKAGVTRYMNAIKALDAEMKPMVSELQTIQTRLQSISTEIANMTKNTAVPVNQQTIQAKQEEGQALQRTGEFKKKEYDAALETKSAKVLGPVSADISRAIQEFAKQKGYAVVLDISALANANAILSLDPSANITKEFIAYYNTRPATTATTAVPK